MARRFGWLFTVLGFGSWLRHLRLEQHSVEPILAASAAGPIVYVMPRASAFDHLALNVVLNARRLPISGWARGVGGPWYRSVAAWCLGAWRRAFGSDPVLDGSLTAAVDAGEPAVLFCDDQGPGDPFAAIAACRSAVQLVPVMVVWDKGPEAPTAVRHFLLGQRDAPGWIGRWVQLLWHGREAFVHVGRPIPVATLRERVDGARLAEFTRKVVRLARRGEAKVVRGPALLPASAMKTLVLDNPPMRRVAHEEAVRRSVSDGEVLLEMSRHYDRIAAQFSWPIIRALDLLLQPLWTRVFSGVDVRDEDLARLREAMRDGAPVLVPCHKSHFDYILVTWVMYSHDMIVPHVIAGMNLAVWPISVILRGAGGFFIKRSFADDAVFPAVFARYLRELLHHEYPVEFFPEGGRTRTGRLMPAKTGVLGMVLDAASVRPANREVTILPIALAYEQVAEEGVYAAELGGQPKRAESFGELLRARTVLRRRYGRVYLRVGEPIRCSELVDATAERPSWPERDPAERRQVLVSLGARVMRRIGQVMVVLPTSLAALGLLAHHRRGVPDAELRPRAQRFFRFLTRAGLLPSAALAHPEQALTQALDRFVRDGRVQPMEADGQRVWVVPPDQRITLDFYKNQVLHAFAEAATCAAAIRALPDRPFTAADVQPGVEALRGLLAREFVWDPDTNAAEAVRRGLTDLVAHGALRIDAEGFAVADPHHIGEVLALIRSLLEGLRFVADAAGQLPPGGADRDSWAAELLRDGDARLADGRLTRPEALARDTLKNHVEALISRGALRRDGSRVAADAAPLREVSDILRGMVGG